MEQKEIKLDEKVNVFNIATHQVGYSQVGGGTGTRFGANGTVRVRREEIVQQVQNGNRLYVGTDGRGSHATLVIEDKATRELLGFEGDDIKEQNVLTEEKVKKIFALKTFTAFEKNIVDAVVTRNEKLYLKQLIKKLKFNEYDKIIFCEKHCKWHF